MGAAILVVVNGPIAREIGMNSGVSVFGPGNRANATIGRAIRLIQINATGAVPGELDKAALGHAGKYTWCIAEAEDASPWEPLHVERGFEALRQHHLDLRRHISNPGRRIPAILPEVRARFLWGTP